MLYIANKKMEIIWADRVENKELLLQRPKEENIIPHKINEKKKR